MQILSTTPAHPPDELISRIVESETFRSAPMMRTLLIYLWKHHGERISEYAVGIDALGRPPSFDPKTDSTVRVQISRLRAKLKEFYEVNGDSFPLKLSIPLGRHDLEWTYEAGIDPKPAAPTRSLRRRMIAIAATVAALVLLSVCVLLWSRVHALESSAPAALPRLWQAFLSNGKPVEIVIPSPLYFSWPAQGVVVRDLNVSEFANWSSSPVLREMSAKWGPPVMSQTYVGAPEMNAGTRLLQYLQPHAQQTEMIESRKFAADAVSTRNTIFLGMPRTAVYLNQIADKLNFHIERVQPDVIRNQNPRPGEPSEFREVDYSPDRIRYPGIVALLPPRPEQTRTLILFGRSPVSLAAVLCSPAGLSLLEEQWRRAGSPDAWELVVETDTYRADTVSKILPVAFRAIPPTFWK